MHVFKIPILPMSSQRLKSSIRSVHTAFIGCHWVVDILRHQSDVLRQSKSYFIASQWPSTLRSIAFFSREKVHKTLPTWTKPLSRISQYYLTFIIHTKNTVTFKFLIYNTSGFCTFNNNTICLAFFFRKHTDLMSND